MRRYLLLAATAFAVVMPSVANANGWILTGQRQKDQYGFRKTNKARAAPWFLYWPYEAYFTVPAPTGAVPTSPPYQSAGQFHPQQYHAPQPGLAPYPTNGYGQ